MQHGERVGGPRLAVDGDQHATAGGERLENSAIVRLKTDAAHRSRQAELGEIARRPLKRSDERSLRQQRPGRAGLDPFRRTAERRSMSAPTSGLSFAMMLSDSAASPARFSASIPFCAQSTS